MSPAAGAAILYGLSRLGFFLAGVRYDMSPLSGKPLLSWWQMLDSAELHHHPLTSLWNLHSQPPLLNAVYAVLLRLPRSSWQPLLVAGSLALGLVLVLSVLGLCRELELPRWVRWVVVTAVVADPSYVLFENLFFDTYTTAALVTVTVYSGVRFARTRSVPWGLSFFGAASLVVMLNSTFQWPWLLLVAAPVAVTVRGSWKRLVAVAALPLAVVAFWYGKDAAVFGTSTTSSWLGMNLAKITIDQMPPAQLQQLVAEHRVGPVALIPAFSQPAQAYQLIGIAPPRPTGVGVLDAQAKSDGSFNFNNLAFVAISGKYLSADIDVIRAAPTRYARSLIKAFVVFSVPPDQYQFTAHNEGRIATYVRGFDLLVAWQPLGTNPATLNPNAVGGIIPSPAHVSYQAVIGFLLTVVALPALLWMRRRRPGPALLLWLIWMTTVYVTVVSNFVELGENNRFRLDLGPLPLVASAFVAAAVYRYRLDRRGADLTPAE